MTPSPQPAPQMPDAARRAADTIRSTLNINPHGPFNEHAGEVWANIIRAEYAVAIEPVMPPTPTPTQAEAERDRAQADLVETRLALTNAEACRAEAERLANTSAYARAVLVRLLTTARDELDAAHRALADPAQAPIAILNRNEMLYMVAAMKRYGGGFVQTLAECFLLADEDNLDRLYRAFSKYVAQYLDMAREDERRSTP